MDHYLVLDDGRVRIPLNFHSIMSHSQSRNPTMDKYEQAMLTNQIID